MRKFILAVVLCVFAAFAAQAQEIGDIPMYGGEQSAELKKINDKFIETMTAQFGSREAGAKDALARGYSYIAQGNLSMAMKRFNQAWLLTPENGEVFEAFGMTRVLIGEYEEAGKYYEKAISLMPDDGGLLADYALVYLHRANNRAKPKDYFGLDYIYKEKYEPKWQQEVAPFLEKSVELSERASRIAPKDEAVYVVWATALYAKGDYAAAWEKVKIAEQLGGTKLLPKFIKALSRKMKRP